MAIEFPGDYYRYNSSDIDKEGILSYKVPTFIKVMYTKGLLGIKQGTEDNPGYQLGVPSKDTHKYIAIPDGGYVVRFSKEYRSEPDELFLMFEKEFEAVYNIPEEKVLTQTEIKKMLQQKDS